MKIETKLTIICSLFIAIPYATESKADFMASFTGESTVNEGSDWSGEWRIEQTGSENQKIWRVDQFDVRFSPGSPTSSRISTKIVGGANNGTGIISTGGGHRR